MPDTPRTDRRQTAPDPAYPPFHVILSYLLGAWADLGVSNVDRRTPKGRETRP